MQVAQSQRLNSLQRQPSQELRRAGAIQQAFGEDPLQIQGMSCAGPEPSIRTVKYTAEKHPFAGLPLGHGLY